MFYQVVELIRYSLVIMSLFLSLNPGVGSSQRLKNWHLLLPWLAFTIKGLEQGWLHWPSVSLK